jgi:DNA gyrase subunit A
MVTYNGIIKKTLLSEFSNARKNGIIAIGLREDDSLLFADILKDEEDIFIGSRDGLAVRANLAKLRCQGRTATGVIGMRLEENDSIAGVAIVREGSELLVITEKGYGKRTDYAEFNTKGRGGKGMAFLKVTDKNGKAVRIASVSQEDEIMVMAQSGMIIRVECKEIGMVGRATVGVRVVNLKEDDVVVDFALLSEKEEE